MRRRDFTVNAMARRLETGELLDPLGGERDLAAGVLRTVGPRSFEEDPLRIVRGLRFVSQLGFEPDEDTLRQMREHAAAVDHVSGERIGGGLQADGLGELSRLLLGREPLRALRLARDTGVLVHVLPELEPALGFDQDSRYHDLPLDEHLFRAVQAAADAGAPLAVRLALLLHDSGKPASAWLGDDGRLHYYANPRLGKRSHEAIGAELAGRVLARLRYPSRLAQRVRRLVRAHMFQLHRPPSAVRARRFLARHGEALAADLVAHKRADVLAKRETDEASVREELAQLDEFEALLRQESDSPWRLDRLAVDGADLLALGFEPGPRLGRALDELLRQVVERPELNTREELLDRAARRLGRRR
jgi:tRNA nucleotidyltransferase/poly(A) polymerase